jgi:hypothetical protein
MKLTTSKVIGLLLAVIHLVLFVLFSVVMNFGSQDAMAGMLWGLWKTVDFPVSLLAFYGFMPVPIEWSLPLFVKFIFPYLVHGVLGTIWWFFIPIFIGGILHKLLPRKDVVHD